MKPVKIVVVGPVGGGKTTISNFLADATEISSEYHPTQGVRILEFEVEGINVKNQNISADIELWDCSGDQKFEKCWPAIRQDLKGVVFVYSGKLSAHIKELETLYDYFVNQSRLGPENCVLFYFNSEKIAPEAPRTFSSVFAKISHVTCNFEDGGNKLKNDFQVFISTLLTKIRERSELEEKLIMDDNFTKIL